MKQKKYVKNMSNQNGKIKVCSLFSGIGGFELGIIEAIGERADFVAYSEVDKYAIQIYEKHFPKHKNYGDITRITPSKIPDHDLIVGGFPCQSFSIAGKRGGFEDTRGTLFFNIAEIAKVKRPRFLLLENVKGLLSHNEGNTFATIISTLDEVGYDCQWQVLNSKNFGVPQNRERVFIIGHLRGTSRPKVFPITGTYKENIKKVINPLKGKTKYGWHLEQNIYDKKGITRTVKAGGGSGNMPKVIQQLNKPKHSNDRVYLEEGLSPTINTAQGGNRQPFIKISKNGKLKSDQDNAATLTGGGHSGGNHSDMDLIVQPVLTPDRLKKRQEGRRFKKDGDPSFTLTGQDVHGVAISKKEFKLQEENSHIPLGKDYKDPKLVAMRWQRTEKGKKARRENQKKGKDYTPFSDGHRELVPIEGKPVGALTSQAIAKDSLIGNEMKIRRLTPTECERLQGFPDGWTEYGIDEKGNKVNISDSQRYKCLGNAVTVNVIKAIMERLIK